MRYERYKRIDNAIKSSDSGGIWERWRYGRRLVCDSEMTTPNENLRDGKLEWLVQRSRASRREIQYRLQAARAYPKESQLRSASAQYATWWDLIRADFPAYEGDLNERPYNPLETDELVSQAGSRGRRLLEESQYEGGGLFPVDAFGPASTLAELARYTEEMAELTGRFAARDDERRLYLDRLIKAVDGDMAATWEDAERALGGE